MSVDQSGAQAGGSIVGRDQINIQTLNVYNTPPELADGKIKECLHLLRAKRQFAEYDRIGEAKKFAESCIVGSLSGGTAGLRSIALAWCSRIISSDDIQKAEELLAQAKALEENAETRIASAFVASKSVGKSTALKVISSEDGPAAASARLYIVFQHDEKTGALAWFDKAGLDVDDLDSDGKNLLLDCQLEQRHWDVAYETAKKCTDDDCSVTPILRLNRAFAEFLTIVPEEYRPLVHKQLPFELRDIEFDSGENALVKQKSAQLLFAQTANHLSQLGLPDAAKVVSGYSLWLALRYPDQRAAALQTLRGLLNDPAKSLMVVPFAMNFGVDIDVVSVEREIDRQIALNGGPTADTAVARLSLSLGQPTPAGAASYIARHRTEFEDHIDQRALAFCEVQLLIKSGRSGEAKDVFDRLLSSSVDLSEDERARFDLILAVHGDDDPVAAWRTRFEATGELVDLRALVELLDERNGWDQLVKFAGILHSKTQSLWSAEKFVGALIKTGRDEEVLQFLDSNHGLIPQSHKLRSIRCWAFYRLGRMIDAKHSFAEISNQDDPVSFRVLRRNIALGSGDWNELSRIVADDASSVSEHSALQLLQTAYLGFQIGAPAAKLLLFEAAKKGKDEANILAASYFLATNAGLEDDAEVASWLHRAAQLSGDEGPIYRASLEDILSQQPERDRRQQHTLKMFRNSEIPMFIAAKSLGRTLVDVMLNPFLANQREADPRRRATVPAFSGKRSPQGIQLPERLGVDASALLTLGSLGLLESLAKAHPILFIPHSTLEWLFTERQRSAFHQPSQFKRAQELQDFLVSRVVSHFAPNGAPDESLSEEIGEELAGMLGQAQEILESDEAQRSYVIRSNPVHKLGSLLNEDADLSLYSDVLASCSGLVDKLADLGRLTSTEQQRARSFLALNERRWPDEPDIQEGSNIYLDSVSANYLQSIGLIERINSAGFKIFISSFTVEESRHLISFKRLSSRINSIVEEIRRFLEEGISRGTVTLGRTRQVENDEDESELRHHPTFEAMLLTKECDAIVVDDRYINQHEYIDGPDGTRSRIVTSADLLKFWRDRCDISPDEYRDAMVKLRLGGFLFTEINADETFDELTRCRVVKGQIQESAELRSIREALQFAQLRKILNTPDETPWLDRTLLALIVTYRRLWALSEDLESIKARIDWLMPLLDVRGWLQNFPYEQARYILHEGRVQYLRLLIGQPGEMGDERSAEFHSWVDERILEPLRREDFELFSRLVETHKKMFVEYLTDERLLGDGKG